MNTALLVALAALAAFVILGLIRRPRLVLSPLLIPFAVALAVWRKARIVWALPENVTKWLTYSVLEKDAHALRHHAETAAALWSSGFRPAAREVFARVTAGYGIQPDADGGIEGDLPLPLQAFGPQDPYDAAKIAAAAEAVQSGVPMGPVGVPMGQSGAMGKVGKP